MVEELIRAFPRRKGHGNADARGNESRSRQRAGLRTSRRRRTGRRSGMVKRRQKLTAKAARSVPSRSTSTRCRVNNRQSASAASTSEKSKASFTVAKRHGSSRQRRGIPSGRRFRKRRGICVECRSKCRGKCRWNRAPRSGNSRGGRVLHREKNRRRAGENSAPGGTYSKKAPGKGAHPPNRLGQIRLLGSPRERRSALTPAPAAKPRDAFLSNRELSRMNANLFARERQQGVPVREAGNEENLKRFSNSQLNLSGFARIAFSRSFSASFMASW